MQWLRRFSIVGAIAPLVVAIAGCGNNKVAECNKLIDGINKGHTLVTNFQGNNAVAAEALARDLDDIIEELENVELTDKQLKNYQSRFSEIYQQLSKAFRTTGQALTAADKVEATPEGAQKVQKAKAEVEAAGKTAEQAAQKADALANEINSYCGSSNSQ